VTRGLFLGRFQPFHLGHLEVTKRLAAQHHEVILAIGSAQVSHTPSNPFTAGERLEMVHTALAEANVRNVILLALPDVGRNSVWAAHVESYVPHFDILYTNNPLMKRLFEEAGHKVAPAPFHQRADYEGTPIRALMAAADARWRMLVPPAVVKVIVACDGEKRIHDIGQAGVTVEGSDPQV
jgi:nicotinamide-nucleotide adenylyltransferase